MERILALNLLATAMKRINACRLFLQVTHLSDISTLKGNTVTRNAWLGARPMPASDADWPVQGRPEDKVWSLWRKALSNSVCTIHHRYVLATRPGILAQGLGAWLPGATFRQSPQWKSFVQHSTQRLFVPYPHVPDSCRQLSTATRLDFGLVSYSLSGPPIQALAHNLPMDVVPAEPTTGDGHCIRTNRFSTPTLLSPEATAPPACDFLAHLATLPKWQKELLAGVFQSSHHDPLGQHLLSGDKLFMCSDGGAKDHAGSFGWVIATATTVLWECVGTATGWFANSFRSEGVGQLSMMVFTEVYVAYHGLDELPTPTFPPESTPWKRTATNNEGLITRILTGLSTKTAFAGTALSAKCNAANKIIETERRLPFRLKWEHVKGHQDDKKKWCELTWMETLNVRADLHATYGLDLPGAPPTLVTMMPSAKSPCESIKPTSRASAQPISGRPQHDQLCCSVSENTVSWDDTHLDSVDWKAHHGVIEKLRFTSKKFITKFIHQSLPMGAVCHKIDPSQSITCSSCKQHPECEAHLHQCPARRLVMVTFLDVDPGSFLEANHTCPTLVCILLDALHCNVSDQTPNFKRRQGTEDPRFRALLTHQTNLGWSQPFQGRLVQDWSQLQEAFLLTHHEDLELDRRCWTGDIWARKLISLLWFGIRSQWDLCNADRHGRTKAANHAIRHARLLTSITALKAEAPLMLAADCDILAAPTRTARQPPGRLKLWAKRTRAIVTRSKTDTTATIQHTHERLHHCFKFRRSKKQLGTANPLIITQPRNETDPEKPGLI
jgi:hypothetical protein